MKKKLVLFGATGGLGTKLCDYLKEDYDLVAMGSRDLDLCNKKEVDNFFDKNDFDVVVNLTAYNYDCFIHKYNNENINNVNKQIDVNIKGNINILSACLPKMRQKKYGRIIAASSILASRPVVGTSIYSASKSFIETFYKTAALESANYNITCNTIQLGYFDGGLLYKIPEDVRQKLVNNIPSKRVGTIEELNNCIQFLINTPYINGNNIKINGGLD
jgi:NAD(P)-dependent dehydrogenase (short-subunit alcohol dehydrogenase family)